MTPVARDPVVTTGLADQIAFRLRAAILDGEYAPGTHLQQDDLCVRFGVSRTPVREALRKLQAQRLVDIVPNKGATVRIPTRADLIEVYALRAELEGFSTELATPRISDEALAELHRTQEAAESALRELESGGSGTDAEATFDARIRSANEAFHNVIHRAAGNSRLLQYVHDLQSLFPKDYVWRTVSSAEEARVLNIEEHRAIHAALAARDPSAARRAMSVHIEHAGKVLIAYLDARGSWSS